MTYRRPSNNTDIGAAAWAHNRWPTIGLFVGAGVGLVVAVLVVASWPWLIGSILAGAAAGCLLGMGLAKVVYSGSGHTRESDATDDDDPR